MIDDLVIKDALRYLGAKAEDEDATALVRKVLSEYRDIFTPRQVTALFRVKTLSPSVTFENCEIELTGESIARHFAGATEGLFCAFTLGAGVDRKLKELTLVRPAEGVALNAVASAYAERSADELLKETRREIEKGGFTTKFRFCPGYGDLPLETNARIIEALGATKKIGLSVAASGMLLPVKSIVGVVSCLPTAR